MTPLRGLLKRVRKTDADRTSEPTTSAAPAARPASAPPNTPANAPATDAPRDAQDPDAERKRRRRGKRGGRGRGGSAANGASTDAPAEARQPEATRSGGRDRQPQNGAASGGRGSSKAVAEPAKDAQSSTNGSDGKGEKREFGWGRAVGRRSADEQRQARGQRQSQQRRGRGFYRPPRDSLDQPLPEDIAFRPADEGGDSSLLKVRRRPPPGLRTTGRVILGGSRFITGIARSSSDAVDTRSAPEQLREADAIDLPDDLPDNGPSPLDESRVASRAGEPATEAEQAGELPPTRRRRGRRGGRGRRRPGEIESTGTPRADLAAEDESADDVDDDTAEPDTTAEAEPLGAVGEDTVAEPDDDLPVAFEDDDELEARPAVPVDPSKFPPAFRALGLSEQSLTAIAAYGFDEPTPIQARAIPVLLGGGDVVGVAQTGSGKTIAFGVPMVQALDPQVPEVQGIVLVPTRELAQQVLEVLQDLCRPYGMRAIGLLGGRALNRDFQALERRPQIVVGTPGRIIDHLRRGTLSLRQVRYAVLDEADQMLDIGFQPDIRRIMARTPRRRQTALFSATMPTSVKHIIWQFMRDPETVAVDAELSTVESIQQVYFEVAERDKIRGLRELVDRELKGRTLVFCKTKRKVDLLRDRLADSGVRVGALHGDMDQRSRDRVVERFRAGELDLLVATNVAARGLDIPEITHVVNFDVPQNAEEYVHRIGRTGRAGRAGKAITFVGEWDHAEFEAITAEFGERITSERLDLYG